MELVAMNNNNKQIKALLLKPEVGTLLAIVVLSLFLTVTTTSFLTVGNLIFVARGFSFIAIAAMGVCFVIITGGIDLSIGSVMGLCGVLAAYLSGLGLNPFLVLFTSLGVGFGIGLLNGALIAKIGLAPFIVTLGMLSIGRGFVYVITQGWPLQTFVPSLLFLGQGFFLGLPMPVWIMIIILIIIHMVLKYSTFGWYVYSIGGNEEAARLSGVRVERIKMLAYALCGLLAGFSGILLTARLGVGEATAGMQYELNVIAAAVIGGVSLSGGKGSAISALFGAALMGILRNGLVLHGVSAFWQQVVIGTVIILAVLMDKLRIMYFEKN